MVPFPCMCNGTSTFNGLPTIGLCAERVVRFMVMISAEGLPVEDVELFIREGLLAFVAVEAVAVVFALELAIRGRDGLLFDRPVAPSALHNRKEDALVTEVRGPNVRERTLGKYIVFQHLSQSTPAPSARIQRPSEMLLVHFVHCLGLLDSEVSPLVFVVDTVGVVFARIGSFGDRGESGRVGNGGLRSFSKSVSSAPADLAVVLDAREYDDAEDALRVGNPATDICGEPWLGN